MRRLLLCALLLEGCAQRPPPPALHAAPRYVIGAAYQAGSNWYYPREDFRYDATGLAERVPDRTGLTANGEAFDPAAMAGAHQTLQLPAVARVTNLENGRQVLIRLNDRGPANPGRILGLTRRAAELLGLLPEGVARVRVQVEDGPSQALRDALGGASQAVKAAPRGAVTTEALAPPPGTGPSHQIRIASAVPSAAASAEQETKVPDRLPEKLEQVAPQPGQLWIRAGRFGQSAYANQVKAKLYGMAVHVIREQMGRSPAFVVMAGPFPTIPAADAALDRARAAGVTDAVIVVE